MSRLHTRVAKLEAARAAWLESLSAEELEAMIGPQFNEFLDQQSLEDLQQLADGDPDTTEQIWQTYLLWREDQS